MIEEYGTHEHAASSVPKPEKEAEINPHARVS